MKLKEYVDSLSILINEMHSSGLFGEIIRFLKKLEQDPNYKNQAKALRVKMEQKILKLGDKIV